MKIKILGFTIYEREENKPAEDYEIKNGPYTMFVNSANKGKVEMFKQGLNPRCGLPLNQCSEGMGHLHAD